MQAIDAVCASVVTNDGLEIPRGPSLQIPAGWQQFTTLSDRSVADAVMNGYMLMDLASSPPTADAARRMHRCR